jgi:uncharacterized delta-60 repeat protein
MFWRMRSRLPHVVLTLLFGLLLVPATAAAALEPGQPDPAFGTGGYVVTDPSLAAPKQSYANGVAVDAQGRVLVTGTASDADGNPALVVTRLLSDGRPDPDFGTGGVYLQQISTATAVGDNRQSYGLTVDPAPDGGVLVGALRYRPGNLTDLVAVKLNAAGRLDLNYGVGGIGSVAITNEHSYGQARSAVVNSDGSLFLEGTLIPDAPGSGPTENLVLRFDPSGTGTASHFATGDASPLSSYGSAITQLSSGKLLVGGSTSRSNGNTDGYVKRLLSDGTPDDSPFGNGSIIVSQMGSGSPPSTAVKALSPAPDSAFYAVSDVSSGVESDQQVAITRYGAGGQLDSGFGPGGTRILALHHCVGSGSCGTNAGDVLVDAAGRVLVVVFISSGDSSRQFAVARYQPNGLLDPTFGTDGVAYGPTDAGGRMIAMALAPDNRLMLAGSVGEGAGIRARIGRFALEHVDDPPPPTPGPGPGAPPPVADLTAPKLTKLKVSVSKRGKATLGLTSTEAGTLTVAVQRGRAGHRSKGRCSTKAKHGRKCFVYKTAKIVTAKLKASPQTIALGKPKSGRYRAVLRATDAAGNRTKALKIPFRVKRR